MAASVSEKWWDCESCGNDRLAKLVGPNTVSLKFSDRRVTVTGQFVMSVPCRLCGHINQLTIPGTMSLGAVPTQLLEG